MSHNYKQFESDVMDLLLRETNDQQFVWELRRMIEEAYLAEDLLDLKTAVIEVDLCEIFEHRDGEIEEYIQGTAMERRLIRDADLSVVLRERDDVVAKREK